MITSSEIKFAENVMLIDAAYINKVTNDLSHHFSQIIGRKLPKADLALFLECLSMDAGIERGEHSIQSLFIYDQDIQAMDAFQPGDLQKELNDVAFKSDLGEFLLNAYESSDMVKRETFFLESVKLVADAKEVKRLILVPFEGTYVDELSDILKKVEGKESVYVFGMNPPIKEVNYQWEMLGFAVMQSLGIRANEI